MPRAAIVGAVGALAIAGAPSSARADDTTSVLAVSGLGGAAHDAARAHDAATWYTYAAFGNDAFSELDPPLDDWGFTHDNALTLRRSQGEWTAGGSFLHRFITSTMDRRRWDELDVVAIVERTWIDDRAGRTTEPTSEPASERAAGLPLRVTTWSRLGPTFGGNFGGMYLQNGWHSISGTGPTVDQGLANDYPAERKFGALAAVGGGARLGEDRLHAYALVDGQLALGQTGVTSFDATVGGTGTWHHVGASGEVAVTRYHVGDEGLALPGAYRPGWQFEWRVGVHVAWSRFRISYQYRANESGSGEPIGVVAFESRR